MGIILKILTSLLIAGALIYGLGYLSLVLVGNYLTPSDTLEKSDAIVVLSGGSGRAEWGIKLYQEGWAGKIIFSGAALDKSSPSNAAVMKKTALAAGVPAEAIFLEEKSGNTLENAENSKQVLDSLGAKKLILVTSPYHQRRAYETFANVYGPQGAQIINSPSGYSDWSVTSWWERSSSSDIAISELLKLLWSKLTGEYS